MSAGLRPGEGARRVAPNGGAGTTPSAYSEAMPHAEVTLPGAPSSVPTARRFVESILTSWGHPEQGWTAALLVSELSANCTLHARTDFTVRVELSGEQVRLQVTDGSLRAPAVRDYGATATTGRGLRLVDELSNQWGVDLHDDGKTVWVELRSAGSAPGSEDEESLDVDALLAAFGEDDPDEGDVIRLVVRQQLSAAA